MTRRSRIYTWYPNLPVNIICSELHISNLWNALLIQCKPLSLVNQYWEIIHGVRVLIRVPFNLLIVLRFHIKCPISNSEVDPLFWYRQNWKLLEWERYANRRQKKKNLYIIVKLSFYVFFSYFFTKRNNFESNKQTMKHLFQNLLIIAGISL